MGRRETERPQDSPEVTRNGAVIGILISLLMLGVAIFLERLGGGYRIGTYVLGVFGGMGVGTGVWALIAGQGGTRR